MSEESLEDNELPTEEELQAEYENGYSDYIESWPYSEKARTYSDWEARYE